MSDKTEWTPAELAEELGIDAKTLRRNMRQIAAETPGSGGRWMIDAEFRAAIVKKLSTTHSRNVVRFRPKEAE